MQYKRYPTPPVGVLGYDLSPTYEHGPPIDPDDIPLMDLIRMVQNHSLPKPNEHVVPTKTGVRMGIGSYPDKED